MNELYLDFGYAPNFSYLKSFDQSFFPKSSNGDFTLHQAGKILKNTLDRHFSHMGVNSAQKCIVPISGGLDSRLLLASAVNYLGVDKVHAYSFGEPGLLDFEIGTLVARRLGVEHTQFDLNKFKFDNGDLNNAIRNTPWSYVPDVLYNQKCASEMVSSGDLFLSGFMGDPLTGGHIYQQNSCILSKVRSFIAKQRRARILPQGKSELVQKYLIQELSFLKPDFTWHEEVLDYSIRQSSCVAPIVLFMRSWDGSEIGGLKKIRVIDNISEVFVSAPFTSRDWVHFWLEQDASLKYRQANYVNFIHKLHPSLSDIPFKNNMGVHLSKKFQYIKKKIEYKLAMKFRKKLNVNLMKVDYMSNYLDYWIKFKNEGIFRNLASGAVQSLNESHYELDKSIQCRLAKILSSSHCDPSSWWNIIGYLKNIECSASKVTHDIKYERI